ncbi:MAG: hypothetical protein MHMPM18_002124 [Marteilia pararefringens]
MNANKSSEREKIEFKQLDKKIDKMNENLKDNIMRLSKESEKNIVSSIERIEESITTNNECTGRRHDSSTNNSTTSTFIGEDKIKDIITTENRILQSKLDASIKKAVSISQIDMKKALKGLEKLEHVNEEDKKECCKLNVSKLSEIKDKLDELSKLNQKNNDNAKKSFRNHQFVQCDEIRFDLLNFDSFIDNSRSLIEMKEKEAAQKELNRLRLSRINPVLRKIMRGTNKRSVFKQIELEKTLNDRLEILGVGKNAKGIDSDEFDRAIDSIKTKRQNYEQGGMLFEKFANKLGNFEQKYLRKTSRIFAVSSEKQTLNSEIKEEANTSEEEFLETTIKSDIQNAEPVESNQDVKEEKKESFEAIECSTVASGGANPTVMDENNNKLEEAAKPLNNHDNTTIIDEIEIKEEIKEVEQPADKLADSEESERSNCTIHY